MTVPTEGENALLIRGGNIVLEPWQASFLGATELEFPVSFAGGLAAMVHDRAVALRAEAEIRDATLPDGKRAFTDGRIAALESLGVALDAQVIREFVPNE